MALTDNGPPSYSFDVLMLFDVILLCSFARSEPSGERLAQGSCVIIGGEKLTVNEPDAEYS